MRWHLSILPAAGMLAGALALSPAARPHEVARLRAHFDSVDTELRQSQPLQLSPGQRTARVTLIGWLREYREAGQFPRNDRFPTRAMPFFRDSHGALCAMAYLIERSGRGDLVDRVALTRNNAFIADLADDPDLRAWLDSVGLSLAEAARIQPQYEGIPIDVIEDDRLSPVYAVTSLLVSGTSLATLGFNLIAPSKSSGWAGLIAGGAGVIAGAAKLDGTGATEDVATANMIIGGAAMVAGAYRLLAPGPARTFSPLVLPGADGTRLGLAVHTNF